MAATVEILMGKEGGKGVGAEKGLKSE